MCQLVYVGMWNSEVVLVVVSYQL